MMRSRSLLIALTLVLALGILGFAVAQAGSDLSNVQYIVHPGDTLYRIAAMHGVTVRQLVTANRIPNPNLIYIGQVLRIPKEVPAIILEAPASGSRVTSPVTVQGRANTFEGQVLIRILDSRFRQIGSGTATAAMGEYAPFRAEVSFSVPYSQWGYIDVYWLSPKDGAKRDMVTVKVYLQRSVATATPTPAPTPSPTATPSPSPTPTAAPTTEVTYHVHPGDTLYRIALGHQTSVRDIVRRNRIPNPNRIYVGQRLVIPSEHPGIILTAPVDGQTVSSPITVTGQSDTFEGAVVVRVLDYRFRQIGTANTTGGSLGSYAPFTTTVAYAVPSTQWGYVEAYWQSPKDGSRRDAVTARVRLQATPGPTPETPTVRYHVVRWGETLFGISRRYGVSIRAIAEANGIRNVNRIYAGQRLVIPQP